MATWYDHLSPLDQRPPQWTCRARVDQLLAGETVHDSIANEFKDVCDEGHVHTDVTIGLLTATRLLQVVAGDAHHVTDADDLGVQCDVTSLPLSVITGVSVLSWDQGGRPTMEVRIDRVGGAWQALGDLHDCGDPNCDIPPGSIQLEGRPDGVIFTADGDDVDELARFAGAVSLATASR